MVSMLDRCLIYPGLDISLNIIQLECAAFPLRLQHSEVAHGCWSRDLSL